MLWLSAFVGWTAYGLLWMAADMGKAYAWADVLRTSLVGIWGWVPLTVALFWLVSRVSIRRGNVARACSVLMLAASAWSPVAVAAMPCARRWRLAPEPSLPARVHA